MSNIIDKLKDAPVDIANQIDDHAMDRLDATIERETAVLSQGIEREVDHVTDEIRQGLSQAGSSAVEMIKQARAAVNGDLAALADYQIVIRIGIEKKA